MATEPIPFSGVDHIGVVVRDLAAAVDTYQNILGFSISGGETLADRGLEVRFVDTGGTRIELIAATRDDSQISKFLRSRGEGLHHICLRVADIEACLAQLIERGAHPIGEGVTAGAHGTRVAFIHPKSAHGVLLELVEHVESLPEIGPQDGRGETQAKGK